MSRKQTKTAIELVSDIGSKAHDLQFYSDAEIRKAVSFLRQVNGPMFDWLVDTLRGDPPSPKEPI